MSDEACGPIICVDDVDGCEDISCPIRGNIEMKPDEANLNINSMDEVADGCEDEFHLHRNDVEIGTAIPLRRSSLSDPTGGKQMQPLNELWRQYWIYIIIVFMGSIITGLSMEIAKLNRRRSYTIIVTQIPSWQPSSTPSTVPSVVPSSIPSSSPSLSSDVSSISFTYCRCCSSMPYNIYPRYLPS